MCIRVKQIEIKKMDKFVFVVKKKEKRKHRPYVERYDKEKKMIYVEVWEFCRSYYPNPRKSREKNLENPKKDFKKRYIEEQGTEEGFEEVWNTRHDSDHDDLFIRVIKILVPYDIAMIKVLHPNK
jgi:hypothetical protein